MKKHTIMVADDDAHLRSSLNRRLSSLGYGVVESCDGLNVLCQAPLGRLDALILDHGMPNGDGQSVARMLRNETDIPIIFLSGYDRESFQSIVMQLPNTYYLSKPVDYTKLQSLLDSLLHNHVALS